MMSDEIYDQMTYDGEKHVLPACPIRRFVIG